MTTLENDTVKGRRNGALHLKGVDYIEFHVGNASQAAHYYRSIFGFRPVAYAGLETGSRDRVSFILEQKNIRLVVTSSLDPDSPVSEGVRLHGDSVKDIAFSVNDVGAAFEEALRRGAAPVQAPTVFADDEGATVKATVGGIGHTTHSFIERRGVSSACLPGYRPLGTNPNPQPMSLGSIDHVAFGVEPGQLDRWVEYYKTLLGFHQCHQEDISTEYSAMNSKALADETDEVKFVMMEPATGKRRSQIEEFLNFHHGSGVQHIALLTDNIINAVRGLRGNCVDFLSVPSTYYETLEDRVGDLGEQFAALSQLNILVDSDAHGKLMQIFTKPVHSRPTMFFEVIQRFGARGFGGGNIKALFEALEQEQVRRGTL